MTDLIEFIAELISEPIVRAVGNSFFYSIGFMILFGRYRNRYKMRVALKANYGNSYSRAGALIVSNALQSVALWLWLMVFVCFIGGLVWYLVWGIAK